MFLSRHRRQLTNMLWGLASHYICRWMVAWHRARDAVWPHTPITERKAVLGNGVQYFLIRSLWSRSLYLEPFHVAFHIMNCSSPCESLYSSVILPCFSACNSQYISEHNITKLSIVWSFDLPHSFSTDTLLISNGKGFSLLWTAVSIFSLWKGRPR